MDLTNCDRFGNPRGCKIKRMRVNAKKVVKGESTSILLVSSACSAFSRSQSFNSKRPGAENIKRMLECGIKRLNFAMELCESQGRSCLYFRGIQLGNIASSSPVKT